MNSALAPSSGRPLFVVGCGRSGTTILRLMLDAHPELAVPGESHFIPPLWRARARYVAASGFDAEALAHDIVRTPHFGHWKVPETAVWRRVHALDRPGFAEVVDAVFMANADVQGKTRWGDKTPIHVLSMPLLADLFPGALFVHLIRDGRDVALSYLSIPWGPSSIWAAARKWNRDVGTGRGLGGALPSGTYLEIRYEELVADPRATLETVCSFAGLSFSDEMLDPSKRADHPTLAPESGRPYHARSAEPVAGDARDWRKQMSQTDVRRFEAVAGHLLRELGYERRFPDVPGATRAYGAVRVLALDALAAGSEARKRLTRKGPGRPPARVRT